MNYLLKFRKITLCLFAVFLATSVLGQSVLGIWKTVDDETGAVKSLVEIYEREGKVFGRIIQILDEETTDPDPLCTACKDDRKDQRIVGMDILRNLEEDGNEYVDGTICDPENGKVYDCKIWVDSDDPNKLMVRGYLYFIYRTQEWIREVGSE